MRHNTGTMLVSDAERVQLAKQRHAANEQRLRELEKQREAIACTKKRRCYILPPLHDPCEACMASGWLLFELLVIRDRVRVSADYLRRALKRQAGK
jgi:hypothetical protein